MATGDTLDFRKEKAIQALLVTPTLKEAAKLSCLSLSTLNRYLKDPKFKKQYREARKQTMETATGQLQAGSREAVHALMEIIRNPKTKDYAKVQACSKVIEMAYKALEMETALDIQERLEELEEGKGQAVS